MTSRTEGTVSRRKRNTGKCRCLPTKHVDGVCWYCVTSFLPVTVACGVDQVSQVHRQPTNDHSSLPLFTVC